MSTGTASPSPSSVSATIMSSPPSDTTGTTVCDSTATGTATFESKSTVKVSTQSDKSEVTANDDGIKQEIKSSPLERYLLIKLGYTFMHSFVLFK